MKISSKDINRIAQLARVELSKNDSKKYNDDLNSIVSFVDDLTRAKVSHNEEKRALIRHLPAREDKHFLKPIHERESIIGQFPSKKGMSLVVPAVFK